MVQKLRHTAVEQSPPNASVLFLLCSDDDDDDDDDEEEEDDEEENASPKAAAAAAAPKPEKPAPAVVAAAAPPREPTEQVDDMLRGSVKPKKKQKQLSFSPDVKGEGASPPESPAASVPGHIDESKPYSVDAAAGASPALPSQRPPHSVPSPEPRSSAKASVRPEPESGDGKSRGKLPPLPDGASPAPARRTNRVFSPKGSVGATAADSSDPLSSSYLGNIPGPGTGPQPADDAKKSGKPARYNI